MPVPQSIGKRWHIDIWGPIWVNPIPHEIRPDVSEYQKPKKKECSIVVGAVEFFNKNVTYINACLNSCSLPL